MPNTAPKADIDIFSSTLFDIMDSINNCSDRTIVCIYSDIVVGDCVLYAQQATDSGPGLHSNLALSS